MAACVYLDADGYISTTQLFGNMSSYFNVIFKYNIIMKFGFKHQALNPN